MVGMMMMMMIKPTPQPIERRSVDVWIQRMKTCAMDPSGSVPVVNGMFHGFDSIGVPDLRSWARKRSIRAEAAAMWIASPYSSYGKPIVNEPRAQFALMRAPMVLVAGRNLVRMACMMFYGFDRA